ncbi:MAG: hypothetical protein Q9167_002362 [Letrouitia subvulpina]
MADLDEELLALADGGSSDNEDSKPMNTTAKAASPHSSADESHSNKATDNKTGPIHKGTSKAGGSASRSRQPRKEESEEEGEASSSSASRNSLQSAPMSESESDTSPPMDEDGPNFPLENKFYSEKDKADIMALSEVQRESILTERAALMERKRQDQHLRRLLQAREKADSKSRDMKKRKADTVGLEDRQRKSSRQKTTLGGRKVGETSAPLEAYKRQRQEKGLRDEQRKRDGLERKDRKNRGSVEDGYSDADADGESEVEWDTAKHKADEDRLRDQEPAGRDDFNRARLSYRILAEFCFYPGFKETAANCYMRLKERDHPVTGEGIYKVIQIKGITDREPYAMTGINGRDFTTTQYAAFFDGKVERYLPFWSASSSRFTDAEIENFKHFQSNNNLGFPTKASLHKKFNDIDKLVNYQLTPAELQEKLKKSGVLQQRYANIERASLIDRRRKANLRGDEVAVAKIDAQLAELDGPKLAFSNRRNLTQAATPEPTQDSQQDRLAELNRRNRKQNTEDVRKAQQAERRAKALARKAVERGEAVVDPFARVKTQPRIQYDADGTHLAPSKSSRGLDDLFEDGSKNTSRAASPMPVGNGATKQAEVLKGLKAPQETVNGLPKVGRRNMDDDIIASLDLGIEIDI